MPRTAKLVAQALAYRWGELQETPPQFVDDLMIELTGALEKARRNGEKERAECLDHVLDVLAEGIYRYHSRAGQDVEETLDRAISELRTYYFLKSGIPTTAGRGPKKSGEKQGQTVDLFSEANKIDIILN